MKFIWHGHSCFTIETEEGTVVLDPYGDGSVPGFGPLRLSADAVLCSHEHGDHNNRAAVSLSGRPCGVAVSKLNTWHDDVQGKKRGANTIHILKAEGLTAAHLGDLGCMLTAEQADALKGLDALMVPIGGFYTIDADQALEIVSILNPRVVIPMHYRDASHGYDVIATAEKFRRGCSNPIDYPDNTFLLTKDTAPQTAFLRAL